MRNSRTGAAIGSGSNSYDPTFPYDRNSDAPANPVEKVENYGFNKSAHVLLGNVEADYKIHGFEDLHLHVNLAGEYTTGGEYDHKNPQSTYAYYYGGESENTEKKYNVVATAYAQYTKDFNKANHFDITAGYELGRPMEQNHVSIYLRRKE